MLESDHGRGCGIPVAHRIGPHAHGGAERDLVDAPRARARGRLVTDDQHERNAGLRRLGQRGERVREPGSVCRGRRRDASARTVVGVGGHHAARLMAEGGERGAGAMQLVDEIRVAVSHHAEDVIDVGGEGAGDVCGHGGHGEAFRDGTDAEAVCVSRTRSSSGCVPLFRAPAGVARAGRHEYATPASPQSLAEADCAYPRRVRGVLTAQCGSPRRPRPVVRRSRRHPAPRTRARRRRPRARVPARRAARPRPAATG
ncbi:hypothetical protein SRABI128_01745 [Microbacterium sp. Bi128]|nr:hypothetical protein SRABI128_01745 [Microbacterium sp. Bi128]